ncbi:hypothetical protein BBB39_10980 [Bordetella trematum]|uniref:Flagella biosynthesis protein n=1 Tax=Bordetella trematum TaxID=123899 RepID=A0A157SRB3_9BORD|nr:flagellar protein FlgN [Bordetella trematum]AUL47385.1 hypothetical protein BTL55_10620 [Bordetella trematum]AZR94248.1 hypothetical protein BBB39_10980 [Bordetella trematum]NNH21328.1 flagellar protein FlgN [Bordetella trematum]QIM72789.1 flagellar protein FlgN [Bordetella trematum]SAI53643.1 flagella biosynthesis protein [Bordetella trematum]
MPKSLPSALGACLAHETELIEQFAAALAAEGEALLDRKAVQALKDAAQHKEQLADQLVLASQRRDQVLAAMGLASGHAGTEAAVALHPELSQAWQTLQEQAGQARQANQRNALILEINLRHTEQTLAALRRLGNQGGTTYDASGRGRPLGSASRPTIVAA